VVVVAAGRRLYILQVAWFSFWVGHRDRWSGTHTYIYIPLMLDDRMSKSGNRHLRLL